MWGAVTFHERASGRASACDGLGSGARGGGAAAASAAVAASTTAASSSVFTLDDDGQQSTGATREGVLAMLGAGSDVDCDGCVPLYGLFSLWGDVRRSSQDIVKAHRSIAGHCVRTANALMDGVNNWDSDASSKCLHACVNVVCRRTCGTSAPHSSRDCRQTCCCYDAVS
jgi:hypothetical protein